ncbi:hypothetical protein DEU56DRAFT_943206 [Suillus clintonianus]|uniref:uncharacterized protein n=1 Tax=Suillus clintonianus TaxID=1904413 RepID=UPI001B88153D|nr:uncharacterized protein DEU56DRAFT_943206 [Suillus clintonianus]KAG2155520.1 hypothetical protein DEU56DRAFT_943206 [Suillus clintonianus]
MSIPMDTAALSGLFLEILLYGVFFTLYWFTLFILLKKTGIQRQLILPVATLLLCIATAHLIVDFVRALEAFVFKVDTIGANAYYSNFASPLFVASMTLYITQTILADGIVVWRCYVLNNRSPFVAVPGCIILLANVVTGYYGIGTLSRARPQSNVPPTVDGCIATFDTLTMVVSVTSTILNAWRIYRSRRFMAEEGLGAFLPVFVVVIESGAFYATSILILLVTFFIGSNAQYIMLAIITPIVNFCSGDHVLPRHSASTLRRRWQLADRSPLKRGATSLSTSNWMWMPEKWCRPRSERGVQEGLSMELMTVHITEETVIIQSDMMSRKTS